jgi:hypothetical protein
VVAHGRFEAAIVAEIPGQGPTRLWARSFDLARAFLDLPSRVTIRPIHSGAGMSSNSEPRYIEAFGRFTEVTRPLIAAP